MITAFSWHDSHRAALLETDWTKMQERLRTAESELRKRQHVLSMDHGGAPEERQAIADALNGMKSLEAEVAEWQDRQVPDRRATTPD
jgi:DnaJ-domain-containing protein 1